MTQLAKYVCRTTFSRRSKFAAELRFMGENKQLCHQPPPWSKPDFICSSIAWQAFFQRSAFLRIASLVVGDAIRRGDLTLDGPE